MLTIFIRFLFFFLTIFLTGFNSYSQNWANNLRLQQLSKGDLDFYDYQNAFYQDYPKDIVKDGYKLVNNQNEKIPYWKLFKRWEWQMESRVDKQTGNFVKTRKISRNEPCSCGSGKKYKHCHGKVA